MLVLSPFVAKPLPYYTPQLGRKASWRSDVVSHVASRIIELEEEDLYSIEACKMFLKQSACRT